MTDTKTAAKQQQGESWGELAKTVIYAGLIAIVIRTFLFQPFNIPSGSMENTLLIGDYLFVEKFAYGYSRYTFPFGGWPFGQYAHGRFLGRDPQRGDVVVFKFPQDNSTDFIKRVIGLPGDHVQMKNDVLYLNGKPVPRERVADYVGELDGQDGHWTAISRNPAGRQKLCHAGQIYRRADGQYRGVRGAARPLFHDGRQSRQFQRQPRRMWAMCRRRIWKGKALFRFFSTDGTAHFWEVWKWPFAVRYSRILTLVK